jgi:hypothetical protein
VPENQFAMLAHLLALHPVELAGSESFRRVLEGLSKQAFDFGQQLGKLFRGDA